MMDQSKLLSRVRAFVERGERVSAGDCEALFGLSDLGELARLARVPRDRRHGRGSHYGTSPVRDWDGVSIDGLKRHIYSPESIIVRVGRLDVAMLKDLQRVDRTGHLQILIAPSVVADGARRAGISVTEFALALAASGTVMLSAELPQLDLHAVSGKGASIILHHEWLDIHRAAHGAGIGSVAAFAYGPIDRPAEYTEALGMIRALQDETTGFVGCVPVACCLPDVREGHRSAPTALQTLRAVACSRLYLDNVPHIGIPATLVGLEIAIIALSYGADTIDLVTGVPGADPAGDDLRGSSTCPPEIPAASNAAYCDHPMVRARLAEAQWTGVETAGLFDRPVMAR